VAVRLKVLSVDQVLQAVDEKEKRGGTTPLGQIFLDLGMLEGDQLQRVIDTQKQIIAHHRAQQAVESAAPVPQVESRPAAPTIEPAAAKPAPTVAEAPEHRAPAAASALAETPTATTPAPSPSPSAAATASASPVDPEFVALLQAAAAKGASDIHLHSGVPLYHRVAGAFETSDAAPLEGAFIERAVASLLSDAERARFEEAGELDLAVTVPDTGRYRVNVYRQQHGVDLVLRALPPAPPSLSELGLPDTLSRLTSYHQGMVLVTGPKGCGKSSTLAALVDIINGSRDDHILTVEDPIEVLHPSKRCIVNQRDVGRHTESFARALRAALREDPDVIVIGELRDFETISLALTAAETGHLVLGTLHTDSAIRTINRLIGVFPADQQDQVRNMLSESLRAVVSQRLVPTVDGSKRVPALETLIVNRAVGNLVRENKTFQIQSILQTGASQGMCMLDDSLRALVSAGTVTKEEALRHCDDPKKLGA
jgi:twitching motility protein PilT